MKLIPCLIILITISCRESKSEDLLTNKSITLRDTFNLPLDTTKIIELINLEMIDSAIKPSGLKLDTFNLTYMGFACDCQQWVLTEKFSQCCLNYALIDSFGYFLEPAEESIQLPDEILCFNNRITVTGTVHEDSLYPTESTISNRKQVITYYSYMIVKPAKVFGPLYFTHEANLNGKSNTEVERSRITIH